MWYVGLWCCFVVVGGVPGYRGQGDRQVARTLVNRRRAPHRARAEALDRRSLIGVGLAHDEIVLEQFVVVLGVSDRRLQQLAPVPRHLTRCEREDSACLWNTLASQMPGHHPRLARRGAHVAGMGAHDPAPRRFGGRRASFFGLNSRLFARRARWRGPVSWRGCPAAHRPPARWRRLAPWQRCPAARLRTLAQQPALWRGPALWWRPASARLPTPARQPALWPRPFFGGRRFFGGSLFLCGLLLGHD